MCFPIGSVAVLSRQSRALDEDLKANNGSEDDLARIVAFRLQTVSKDVRYNGSLIFAYIISFLSKEIV